MVLISTAIRGDLCGLGDNYLITKTPGKLMRPYTKTPTSWCSLQPAMMDTVGRSQLSVLKLPQRIASPSERLTHIVQALMARRPTRRNLPMIRQRSRGTVAEGPRWKDASSQTLWHLALPFCLQNLVTVPLHRTSDDHPIRFGNLALV
jgi:hypothetical protein